MKKFIPNSRSRIYHRCRVVPDLPRENTDAVLDEKYELVTHDTREIFYVINNGRERVGHRDRKKTGKKREQRMKKLYAGDVTKICVKSICSRSQFYRNVFLLVSYFL